VIEEEGLQQRADAVGQRLLDGLGQLQERHPIVGDVRGLGLFLGLELVLDHQSLAPASTQASHIVERMKAHDILLSVDGPRHNVLKIKPPLVFNHDDAERLLETLDTVLSEDVPRLSVRRRYNPAT
jgi:ethanolamine-phosphate phospho-lyase